MIFRTCCVCGDPMDPGEGQNGKCEDCVIGETKRQRNKEELDRMVLAVSWEQMEMEDFINVGTKTV